MMTTDIYYPLTRLSVYLDLLVELSAHNLKMPILLATTLLIMFSMLSKTLDVNAHYPLIAWCSVLSKWISLIQRSVIFWPRGCARQMLFFPLDLLCHIRVSHVQIFPILLWSLGAEGEGMMSWSGGGRGEKGWGKIWMFVRSLHHFLLSEALASFLIQWEQRLPDLSGEGRKTAPHLLISCSGLLN